MPKRLPPQFATPTASPGMLLWQATNRWQRGQRRALRDAGLSHLQVMLLASVTSLAEHLAMPLPPWIDARSAADNWQTSAFERNPQAVKKTFTSVCEERRASGLPPTADCPD